MYLVFQKLNLWREGVRGHFCMFGSYKSTFYRWTAAFYSRGWGYRPKFLQYISVGKLSDGWSSNLKIPFWHSAISLFRKKRLFSDKRYFHMNETCKNDPGPPLALLLFWFLGGLYPWFSSTIPFALISKSDLLYLRFFFPPFPINFYKIKIYRCSSYLYNISQMLLTVKAMGRSWVNFHVKLI